MTVLEVAKYAALEAGKILIKYHLAPPKIERKADNTLVSKADREAEECIRNIILNHFPDSHIIGEEFGGEENVALNKMIWAIDPLDGTTNFLRKSSNFCVSIGVFFDNEWQVGVIWAPIHKEMFCAEKGKGSFLNSQKISVSDVDRIQDSVIHLGRFFSINSSSVDLCEKRLYQSYQEILDAVATRSLGTAAYEMCLVACGRADIMWQRGLSIWDMAAGKVIVEEAGGICLTEDNKDLNPFSAKNLVCSNSKAHLLFPSIFTEE